MAMSGVTVDESCINYFQGQKMTFQKVISYICYKIKDDKMIVIDYYMTKSGRKLTAEAKTPEEDEVLVKLLSKEIEAESPLARWERLLNNLPDMNPKNKDQGRYYTFDFACESKSGEPINKLLFITWAPDTAPIKQKMLTAASKDNLRKKLVGLVAADVQANGLDELQHSEIMLHVQSVK